MSLAGLPGRLIEMPASNRLAGGAADRGWPRARRLHLLVTAPRSAAVYDEAAWGYNWVFNFQTSAAASFPGWIGEATG
jgi:hypothetical protein